MCPCLPAPAAAHLHHPPATALSYLDEADPLLDAILSDDLGPLPEVPPAQHAQPQQPPQQPAPQQQQQQQQAHQQQQGHGPLDPVQERLVPVGNGHHHHHQQHHAHQQQHSMLPSLGAVFHQQQQQPQHRNGYGSHGHGGEHAPPAVKLEGSSFV